jgi:hypothetical protein
MSGKAAASHSGYRVRRDRLDADLAFLLDRPACLVQVRGCAGARPAETRLWNQTFFCACLTSSTSGGDIVKGAPVFAVHRTCTVPRTVTGPPLQSSTG